jgi:hypothetical protein
MHHHQNQQVLQLSYGPEPLFSLDRQVIGGQAEWIGENFRCELERDAMLHAILTALLLIPFNFLSHSTRIY